MVDSALMLITILNVNAYQIGSEKLVRKKISNVHQIHVVKMQRVRIKKMDFFANANLDGEVCTTFLMCTTSSSLYVIVVICLFFVF